MAKKVAPQRIQEMSADQNPNEISLKFRKLEVRAKGRFAIVVTTLASLMLAAGIAVAVALS